MSEEQATKLLNSVFDPSEWRDELVNAVLPVLAVGMAKAMAAQFLSLGVDVRSKRRKNTKDSTATEWLEEHPESLEYLEQMVADAGVPGYGILTEMPPQLKQRIVDQLQESFDQDYWDNISQTTGGDAERILRQGLQDGWSIRKMAKEMEDSLGGDHYARVRATNIARTESGNALNGARKAGMDQLMEDLGPEVPMRPSWLSVLGTTTRLEHAHLDGVPADKGGRWTLAGRKIPWPGHISLPPGQRCNCFPAGTLVSGNFNGAQRGWYEGTFTEVVTRSGAVLAVTENHPIMTSRGWVAAGMLCPGDDVATYTAQVDDAIGPLVDCDQVQYKPVPVEQVFQSHFAGSVAGAFPPVEVIRVEMDYFHGDGGSFQGNIEVVRSDWKLLKDGKTGQLQKHGNTVFVLPLAYLMSESGKCSHRVGLDGVVCAPTCGPSRAARFLDHSIPVGKVTPSGFLSVGVASDLRSQLQEFLLNQSAGDAELLANVGNGKSLVEQVENSSSMLLDSYPLVFSGSVPHGLNNLPTGPHWDASGFESFGDQEVGVAGGALQTVDGFPSKVAFDEVIQVRNFFMVGHVYDLQSDCGVIVAQSKGPNNIGILASNCQCTIVMDFGMQEDEARQLIQDYYGRSGEADLDEAEVHDLWIARYDPRCKHLPGQHNQATHGHGKYSPAVMPDTSGWPGHGWAKWGKNKIAKLEEMAAKGDWDGVQQMLTKVSGMKNPAVYEKSVMQAAQHLIEHHQKKIAEETIQPPLKPAPAPAPAPAPKTGGGVVADASGWQQTGPKLGTQPGGKFKAEDGTEYYVKFPQDPAAARNEIIANKLYALAGGAVPNAMLVERDGKLGIALEWDPNAKKADWKDPNVKEAAAKDFAIHAWTGNWDCIGAGSENPMDNVRMSGGKAVSLDVGGALDMKGTGTKKANGAFGHQAHEWDTLRDANANPSAAAVFGGMTNKQLAESGAKVAGVDNGKIIDVVKKYGGSDELAAKMIARKEHIALKAKAAAGDQPNKETPKQAVTPDGDKIAPKPVGGALPPPPTIIGGSTTQQKAMDHIYTAAKNGNWGLVQDYLHIYDKTIVPANQAIAAYAKQALAFKDSGGKIIEPTAPTAKPEVKTPQQKVQIDEGQFPAKPTFTSSNQANVAANNAVVEQALQHAKAGNLEALKGMDVPPSPKLKAWHEELKANLANQLNPPPPPKKIRGTLAEISAKAAPVVVGSGGSPSGTKIGNYLVLGDLGGVPSGVGGGKPYDNSLHNKVHAEGKQAWDKLPAQQRSAVRNYTGGDYLNMNSQLRSWGSSNINETTMKAAVGVTKASIPLPPGTLLTRGHSLNPSFFDGMRQSVGKVIQDRGIISTKTQGTWPGNVQLRLTVGEGVRGLPARNFSKHPHENEVVLPPNTRYLVTSVKEHTPGKFEVHATILPFHEGQCCPP